MSVENLNFTLTLMAWQKVGIDNFHGIVVKTDRDATYKDLFAQTSNSLPLGAKLWINPQWHHCQVVIDYKDPSNCSSPKTVQQVMVEGHEEIVQQPDHYTFKTWSIY